MYLFNVVCNEFADPLELIGVFDNFYDGFDKAIKYIESVSLLDSRSNKKELVLDYFNGSKSLLVYGGVVQEDELGIFTLQVVRIEIATLCSVTPVKPIDSKEADKAVDEYRQRQKKRKAEEEK